MKTFTRTALCVLVATVGSRVILAAFDFEYRLLSDPFNAGKMMIDVGVFVGLYLFTAWVLGRFSYFAGTRDA